MLRLRSLGESVINVGPHAITPGAPLRFAALLYLSAEHGKRIPRRTLTDLFWPDGDRGVARHSMRHMLYVLRSTGVALSDSPHDVELPTTHVTIDYEEALRTGTCVTCDVGEFLPAYAPSISPQFTDWLDELRSRVNNQFRMMILDALAEAKGRGRWGDVAALAKRCLRVDPLNEEATLALAESTALSAGNKRAAVAIIDRYLGEVGPGPKEIKVPAQVLRTRIAERLPAPYAASGETLFVGREVLLADMVLRLNRARAGSGSAMCLVGTAGIGKSRAALELVRAAVLQGLRPVRITCQPSDVRRPLSAFVDLVPELHELPGALGCSPSSRQFLERLTQHKPESVPLRMGGDSEAEFLYGSLKRSLFDLIDAVSEERTLLVILEDIHWLDRVSLDVLRELIARGESRSVMWLLTSRPSEETAAAPLGFVRGLTTQELAPLDNDASERLFLNQLGRRTNDIDPDTVRRNMSVADGNPFFLRELASHWLDYGDTTELPPTLTAAIEERLSRLDAATLRVFQTCALLGKNATLARVERILGTSSFDLVTCLEALDNGGLLLPHETRPMPKHQLLADGATRRLSPTGARFLHRQVGVALSTELDAGTHSPLLWDCAGHFQKAGEIDRALTVIARCADQLLSVGLASESAEIWQRALPMCTTDEQRLQAHDKLGAALYAAEEYARACAVIEEVASLRARVFPAQLVHDDTEIRQWEVDDALGHDPNSLLTRALTCMRDPRSSAVHRFYAGRRVLISAYNLGNSTLAHDAYATLSRTLSGTPIPEHEKALVDLIYHTSYGDIKAALETSEHLVQLARREGDSPLLAKILRFASAPLRYYGLKERATDLLVESIAVSDRLNLHYSARYACTLLGDLYLSYGELDTATSWLNKADPQSANDYYPLRVNYATVAGQIAVLEGDVEKAEIFLENPGRD